MQWVFNQQMCVYEEHEVSIASWRVMCKELVDHSGRRRKKGVGGRGEVGGAREGRVGGGTEAGGRQLRAQYMCLLWLWKRCLSHLSFVPHISPSAALWGIMPISQRTNYGSETLLDFPSPMASKWRPRLDPRCPTHPLPFTSTEQLLCVWRERDKREKKGRWW